MSRLSFVLLLNVVLSKTWFSFQDFDQSFDKDFELKDFDNIFENFRTTFQKFYRSDEEKESRMKVFKDNMVELKSTSKSNTFEVGINEFSDLSWSEFEATYLMKDVKEEDDFPSEPSSEAKPAAKASRLLQFRSGKKILKTRIKVRPPLSRSLLESDEDYQPAQVMHFPRKISWKSLATPIKNQKRCAACYAFTAVGAVEIVLNLSIESSLSAQEIIDCSPLDDGCVGGNPITTLQYMLEDGITYETLYPFTAKKERCKKRDLKLPPNVSLFSSFAETRVYPRFRIERLRPSVLAILEALQRGVVGVIHVANIRLKSYIKGVYKDHDCTGKINHAALIVGYNLDAPEPYFELKNAWGEKWGENGYYKMAIGELSDDNEGMCRMLDNKSMVLVRAE